MPTAPGFLLDTHAALWLLAGDPRTPDWLRDTSEDLYLSDASIWEVAIKRSLGKIEVGDDFPDQVRKLGILRLGIETEHTWKVKDLPFNHNDPFDRLIIAQAMIEDITIATKDPEFEAYDVRVRW